MTKGGKAGKPFELGSLPEEWRYGDKDGLEPRTIPDHSKSEFLKDGRPELVTGGEPNLNTFKYWKIYNPMTFIGPRIWPPKFCILSAWIEWQVLCAHKMGLIRKEDMYKYWLVNFDSKGHPRKLAHPFGTASTHLYRRTDPSVRRSTALSRSPQDGKFYFHDYAGVKTFMGSDEITAIA